MPDPLNIQPQLRENRLCNRLSFNDLLEAENGVGKNRRNSLIDNDSIPGQADNFRDILTSRRKRLNFRQYVNWGKKTGK
jgi:hypothetical protein